MAANVLADTSFLIAFLRKTDGNHEWARHHASRLPRPWHTCEGVVAETIHLLGTNALASISALLLRGELQVSFELQRDYRSVLDLMSRYISVPMDFADACIVRMSETLPDPVVVTTDSDFRVYRRHSRKVIPCIFPQ